MSIPFGPRPGVPGNMNMDDITKLFGVGQSLLGGLLGGAGEQRESGEASGYKLPKELGWLDKLIVGGTEYGIEKMIEEQVKGFVRIKLTGGIDMLVPDDAKLRVA